MNYKLIKPINPHYSALEQVLTNRGIDVHDIYHWMNTTDADINDFNLLGADALKRAAQKLISTISQDKRALVIVDSDCDGFTSSAILINYLYDHFPAWVENNLDWFIHSGKQHGLSDVNADWAAENYALVLCPDASSNDYEYHLAFIDKGVDIVVLDHHEAEIVSPNAVIINNQLCAYPNKHLSGAGITWQFCRYLDSLMGTDYAQNYLDLVALGNTADMMSLQSIETKHLIFKGFRPENIHNPFIATIAEKNAYSIGDKITPHGAAWYIAPFVNAMVRSGEEDEKELLFKSFLKFKAFDYIYSTKRGHKQGETEQLVVQAVRTCANVKSRQSKAQDAAMSRIEDLIYENNMMAHKVLLFLLEPGEVEPNVAGLVANKIMGKYQRPCAILTKREREVDAGYLIPEESRKYFCYEGSARGCDKADVANFKDICEATGLVQYVAGHQGAFGLGLLPEDVNMFLESTDRALQHMQDKPVHYVDYIYKNIDVNPDQILEIAELDGLWGKDIDESFVAIKGLKVTSDMVQVYVKKNNTLKITLPNRLSIMLFNAPDDLCEQLQNAQGYVEMDILGKPNKNEYMGWVSPQIFIEDYEITSVSRYNF